MTWINKPQRKKHHPKHNRNLDISHIYNSLKWVKLRSAYFLLHPLCLLCLEEGITKPTEEIHHIIPISSGKDIAEMQLLAYNPDNLMALCKECHHNIHNKLRKK